MIVSLVPHFFTSTGGASGRGPTNVSVCEKTLPEAKKIAPIKTTMNLQWIFIKLKYKNMTTFLRQTLYGKLKATQAWPRLNCILRTKLITNPTAIIMVPSQRRFIKGNLSVFKVRY